MLPLIKSLWERIRYWLLPPICRILIVGPYNSGKTTFLRSLQLGQLAESDESDSWWLQEGNQSKDSLSIKSSHSSYGGDNYYRTISKLFSLEFENLAFRALQYDLIDATNATYSLDYEMRYNNYQAVIFMIDMVEFTNKFEPFISKKNQSQAHFDQEMKLWRMYFEKIFSRYHHTVAERNKRKYFWKKEASIPPIYFFLNKKDGVDKYQPSRTSVIPLETFLKITGLIEGFEKQDELSRFIRKSLGLSQDFQLTNLEYEKFHDLFQLKFYETSTKNGDGVYKALEDILQNLSS